MARPWSSDVGLRREEAVMAVLPDSFKVALENIEPSDRDKENAPLAHQSVRNALLDAAELKGWGLDPVLIGSYKRNVSIRRVKDVDVFCRMNTIETSLTGQQVLDAFHSVLLSAFGESRSGSSRITRQARSIQVRFPEYDDLYVDAVPARPRADGYWEIPVKNSTEWQVTNPERLTALKTAMNDRLGDLYVPAVKLLRQARRTLLDTRPGGLFVEMCFYDACDNGRVDASNRSTMFVSGLEAVADYLTHKVASNKPIPDPTMPGRILEFRATDLQWNAARDRFAEASAKARAALAEDDLGKAAFAYREILGKGDEGEFVFPMPAEHDTDGGKKQSLASITPGDSHVPAGDRRFG